MDEQHKNIVDIINGLHEAILDGRNKEVLSRILQELINDAQTHFSYEENLLKTHAYPELEEHKTFHNQLAVQVLDMQKRYLDGRTTLSVEMTNFLKNWLSDHILRVDVKFTPYLKKP